MTTPADIRRLELRVTQSGNRISQRLVFEGTNVDVGRQVYALHDRVCATGYQVRVKTEHIGKIAAMDYPTYAVVADISTEAVALEEIRTDPKDPPEGQGRRTAMSREFFLDHYEVD